MFGWCWPLSTILPGTPLNRNFPTSDLKLSNFKFFPTAISNYTLPLSRFNIYGLLTLRLRLPQTVHFLFAGLAIFSRMTAYFDLWPSNLALKTSTFTGSSTLDLTYYSNRIKLFPTLTFQYKLNFPISIDLSNFNYSFQVNWKLSNFILNNLVELSLYFIYFDRIFEKKNFRSFF